MLTELHGKGGRVCQPAREGKLHCPLIVRPTSEDVITGHLCLALRALNPRWWLPDLLNTALGAVRFRRQVFRRLKIEPWRNCRRYPRELLPWDEGSTQVDITITWENPPTTVFVETKYKAEPSPKTAGDTGESGYPSDQIIRNIRVGLWECGWFGRRPLFNVEPRDFVLILLAPNRGNRLIEKYLDPEVVQDAIPQNTKLRGLPEVPFVGELSYGDVIRVLRRNCQHLTRPERKIAEPLTHYLSLKHHRLQDCHSCEQTEMDFIPPEIAQRRN